MRKFLWVPLQTRTRRSDGWAIRICLCECSKIPSNTVRPFANFVVFFYKLCCRHLPWRSPWRSSAAQRARWARHSRCTKTCRSSYDHVWSYWRNIHHCRPRTNCCKILHQTLIHRNLQQGVQAEDVRGRCLSDAQYEYRSECIPSFDDNGSIFSIVWSNSSSRNRSEGTWIPHGGGTLRREGKFG